MNASKKKALCFSHMCSSEFISGAERNLLFFIEEARGWINAILVVPHEGMLADEARKRHVPVIVGEFPAVPGFLWPKASFEEEAASIASSPFLDGLEKFLRDENPDLVITNTTVHPLPAVAAKKIGIPVAWWIREVIPDNPYYEGVIQFIEQHGDWIPGSSNIVLKRFSPDKTILIYPTWRENVDASADWERYRQALRQRLKLDEHSILVGTLSAYVTPDKGLEHFVKLAISLCRQFEHVHFVCAGSKISDNFYERCLQMLKADGCDSKFSFLDFTRQVEEFYPALDILVVPSLIDEGFGTTALEGLAFAKPVVAYASGGLKEIIAATPHPEFIVEKGNVPQLLQQVTRLIDDRSLRAQVGRSNRIAAIRAFGADAYRGRLQSFLRSMNMLSE